MTRRQLFTLVCSARPEDVEARMRRSMARRAIERACPACGRRAAIQRNGVCRWQHIHKATAAVGEA